MDAETLSPVSSVGIPRGVETMPDSNYVLPMVRCADGDVECLVLGIKMDPLLRLHSSEYVQRYTC
jgi:hypothetical protein